jgi:uncharacterized protein (TIGR02594 family)
MPKNNMPAPSTNKLIVTADSLNVREAPSLQGNVIGSLSRGTVVDWLGSSGDEYWRKVQKGALVGWSSHKYLTPALQNAPSGNRPWLPIALAEEGIKEVVGHGDNPRIVEYLHSTNLGAPYHSNDETPWCSAFVNWCVERAGFAGTDSAAALSWASWGSNTTSPVPGDIVVFNWGGGRGHVGFFASATSSKVKVFGGNQSNAVNYKEFARSQVYRIRKPA